MTRLFLLVLTITFLVGCGKKTADEAALPPPPGAKFGVKAGMSEMSMQMMGMSTNAIVYWDDFGERSVTEVKGEMMGEKMNETTIQYKDSSIKYDAVKKTGVRLRGMRQEDLNFLAMTPAEMKEKGIVEVGKETLLGKECSVYEVAMPEMTPPDSTKAKEPMKGKVWVWKGIPMKMEMGNLMKMETTKLEILDEVPAAKFQVPADVNLKEQP